MRTLLVCSLALSSAAVWAADAAAPAAAPATPVPPPAVFDAPPPPPVSLTPEQEKQAFVLQGFMMGQQLGGMVSQLGMNDAELDALLSGIRLGAKGEKPTFDFQSIAAGADAFFNGRAAKAQELAAEKNKAWVATNAAFLAKVDTDSTIAKTASGLRYKILVPGAAEKPAATNTVKALYTGKLCDGKVFDTTTTRGNEPAEFALNQVIKGWTEGLQLIGKGGKIQLWIPADIGYGAQGNPTIPGGSVLEFEVELVDFK